MIAISVPSTCYLRLSMMYAMTMQKQMTAPNMVPPTESRDTMTRVVQAGNA